MTKKPGAPKTAADKLPPSKTETVRALGQPLQPVRALGQVGVLVNVPAPLQQYLQATLGQIDTVSNDTQALWTAGVRGLQMETAGKIVAGKAFMELRSQLASGEFSAGLAERGIPRASAYDAIESFTLFAALPSVESVQALGQLGVTKSRALRSWTPEQHQEFADGGEVRGLRLDSALEMSSRDLVEQQREWQVEHDDQLRKRDATILGLNDKVEMLQREVKRMTRAGAYAQVEEDLPAFARAARHEACAENEKISFSLESLEAAFETHLLNGEGKVGDHDARPIAARTFYFALAGNFARALRLMQRCRDHFGDAISDPVDLAAQLSPSELAQFEIERERLFAVHQTSVRQREAERANTTPGRRGRPRKVEASS